MLAALLLLSFVLLLGGPNEQAQLDGRWMLIGTVALTLVSAAAWTIAYRALNRRDKARAAADPASGGGGVAEVAMAALPPGGAGEAGPTQQQQAEQQEQAGGGGEAARAVVVPSLPAIAAAV